MRSHPKIVRHYLLGWFVIDFTSLLVAIPDYLDTSSLGSIRMLRVVRALRMLKLVRVVRSSRLASRWSAPRSGRALWPAPTGAIL